MKIGFFEIRPGEEEFFKSKFPDDHLIFSDHPINGENFTQYKTLEIISTHSASKITANMLANLPSLKYIATRTTGVDHIDLAKALEKNIPISNIPSYGENTVAEFAFALILSLLRKVPQTINRVKQTKKFSTEGLTGSDIKDKTIGVLGTGHIGTHLIQIAKGFEMKVLAFDAFPNEILSTKLGFTYVGLDDVLMESDILSFHLPYLPSTHHLINSQNINKIKKGSVLINTSRGTIIETESLVNALEQGIISQAALDVLEEENLLKEGAEVLTDEQMKKTLALNYKLIDMENVFITPHNAFNTHEALQRILDETVLNIESFKVNTPRNLAKPKAP